MEEENETSQAQFTFNDMGSANHLLSTSSQQALTGTPQLGQSSGYLTRSGVNQSQEQSSSNLGGVAS